MVTNNISQELFIARQPIFDGKLRIYGYELLFRDADMESANVINGEVATSKVIIDGFSLAQKGIPKKTYFFINFPYKSLISGIAEILPKETTVVEILEDVIIDRDILRACIDLKKKGYLLALDDFIGHVTNKKLFKLIDIVKIDILNMEVATIEKLILLVKNLNPTIKILVEKVEDRNTFNITKKMGADLFQGYFFQKPELVKGKSIPPTTITKLKLLAFFSKKNTSDDLDELENTIKTDLSLSYKLLQYINSPALGLANKIKKIRQAINLLGYNNVVKWCRIFLLSTINPSDRGIEIIRQSTIRGYFLMGLIDFLKTDHTEDELFMLGLFSLLDALLDQSMEDILALLPLDDTIKDTLLGKKTRLYPYLKLIEKQERGDWKGVLNLLKGLKIPLDIVSSVYANALEETDKLFKATHN
ncbi:EAL and HDOD domain-containing protein [Desulfothermus sp.]